jgi:gliding motility-associated-like protein
VIDAGPEIIIDQFTSTDLLVTASGGSGTYSYFWYPEEYVDIPEISNPSTIILEEDILLYVRVTDNITGCQALDSIQILIDPLSTEVVNAIDDYDTTIVNNSVTIEILENDFNPMGDILNAEILCYPSFGEVELNFDQTITYTPDEAYTGNDTLCYVICEAQRPDVCDTAWVYIYVRPGNLEDDLTLYNGFTPNTDGYNDFFYIQGIESYPDNLLILFNRWGDEVNRFENYNNSSVRWEGDNKNGEPLPDGTYFYILEINGYDPIQGWVFKQSSH